MTGKADRGTPALLVVGQVLKDAAEALASEAAARAHLKVRSGEHLAAIFLSGLLGRTPSAFDDSGGPDLVFDAYGNKAWFPFASPAAFEIKSLPGAFREKMSLLMRAPSSDEQKLPFKLRVWTAAEVMIDAQPVLLKAERQLVDKTPPEYSRNIFLITHPYDHFALDVAQSRTVSHLMPNNIAYDALDSIWVYWPPDKLIVWSRLSQTWTDILFVTDDSYDTGPDETLSLIQNIELTYMSMAGITASPYVFNIRFLANLTGPDLGSIR